MLPLNSEKIGPVLWNSLTQGAKNMGLGKVSCSQKLLISYRDQNGIRPILNHDWHIFHFSTTNEDKRAHRLSTNPDNSP